MEANGIHAPPLILGETAQRILRIGGWMGLGNGLDVVPTIYRMDKRLGGPQKRSGRGTYEISSG
jgi:hypothetical protein